MLYGPPPDMGASWTLQIFSSAFDPENEIWYLIDVWLFNYVNNHLSISLLPKGKVAHWGRLANTVKHVNSDFCFSHLSYGTSIFWIFFFKNIYRTTVHWLIMLDGHQFYLAVSDTAIHDCNLNLKRSHKRLSVHFFVTSTLRDGLWNYILNLHPWMKLESNCDSNSGILSIYQIAT